MSRASQDIKDAHSYNSKNKNKRHDPRSQHQPPTIGTPDYKKGSPKITPPGRVPCTSTNVAGSNH
jgi:hypothetical protein